MQDYNTPYNMFHILIRPEARTKSSGTQAGRPSSGKLGWTTLTFTASVNSIFITP